MFLKVLSYLVAAVATVVWLRVVDGLGLLEDPVWVVARCGGNALAPEPAVEFYLNALILVYLRDRDWDW